MLKYLEEDPRVRRQEMRDRQEATRPRPRQEPPDEPASERTPNLQQVMHAAESLAAVQPPVEAPPSPMNDLGKIESMAKMGGDINLMDGLGDGLQSAGPTSVGEDIGRELDMALDDLGVLRGRR